MWKKISKAEFSSDHIILGGDFNHLEETNRMGISGERQMHRREATSWHHMTLQYSLTDAWSLNSFRKMSKKEYTFDNARSGAKLAISRINKFLVSQSIDTWRGRIEAATSVRKLSNHSPLVITIWGQFVAPNKSAHYFDTSLLDEEECKTAMLEAWEGDLLPPTNDPE